MIFGAVGNQRSGKTLGTVSWVRWLSELSDQPVYSNTPLQFPHKIFREWTDLKNIENALILYDEIDTAIDSRNFKSEDQNKFTHWFKQLGKRGLTLFYTTQRLHMVEKRVREQTDYILSCHKDWSTGQLTQTWFDTQAGIESARLIRTYQLDLQLITKVYIMYNTYQTIDTTMKTEELGNKKYVPYKSKYN